MEQIKTAMDVLNIAPSTKVQAADFAQRIISEVQGGNKNPLELAVQLKALETAMEVIKGAIKDQILKEASTYGDKSFDAYSANISLIEAGVTYDYQACGDPEWEMADAAERSAKAHRIEAEKRLKAMSKPMTIVFQGSDCEITPPVKRSTSTIKIVLQ